MISTAIVYFSGLIMTALLLLLSPFSGSSGFPAGVDSAVATITSYSYYINTFYPMYALADAVSFIVTFELVILSFRIFRWLFGFIPGIRT